MLLVQLGDSGVQLDCIMLCETFMTDNNANLFEIPGYKALYKNRTRKSKGGGALFLRDNLRHKIRAKT
jgi:hypothetical protein